MDSESKFWLILWSIVGTVIVGVVVSISVMIVSTRETTAKAITESVRMGADPIAARCAIEGTSSDVGTAVMCSLATSKK